MQRYFNSYHNNIKKEWKGRVGEENEEDNLLVKIMEESLIVKYNNKDKDSNQVQTGNSKNNKSEKKKRSKRY